jgi:hypothetical protein
MKASYPIRDMTYDPYDPPKDRIQIKKINKSNSLHLLLENFPFQSTTLSHSKTLGQYSPFRKAQATITLFQVVSMWLVSWLSAFSQSLCKTCDLFSLM